jgi:hypothetical protein
MLKKKKRKSIKKMAQHESFVTTFVVAGKYLKSKVLMHSYEFFHHLDVDYLHPFCIVNQYLSM